MKRTKPDMSSRLLAGSGPMPATRESRPVGMYGFGQSLLCISCDSPVKVDAALLELTCLRAPLDKP